ncbi:hypothetical protein [Croceicoccus sp. BE223]|uniref:hypothetical protein n=1 Tax=Croceicoccus sp. BE223 TaxID=2817716 RepID=UPI002867AEDF|nr:hypothetical protein [Croceicoccus sp. BE223]MDR7102248.1 hypothetical protein [Croceicoccus sp. BE223]
METPQEAAQDTLRQTAAALSDLGFTAKPGLRLARVRADLGDEIQLHLDHANRAGEVVRVRFSLALHSRAVRRWRRMQTHPELHADGPLAGIVSATQLAFAAGIAGRDFDVVEPDDRPLVAQIVAARVREVAISWFEETGDPLRALGTLGRPLTQGGPVNAKWIYTLALAHGHDAEARDALALQCVRHPAFAVEFARDVARIRAEGLTGGYRDTTEELAAFAVAAGIAP